MSETVRIFRYAKFDVAALCRLVGKLRGGQDCICDTSQLPACGIYNWTVRVSFSDGVEWVLRSPRGDGAIKCDETNILLLASEAATPKYIKANSTIPVPEVFAYRQARPSLLVWMRLMIEQLF
jgi:hypothetical protein